MVLYGGRQYKPTYNKKIKIEIVTTNISSICSNSPGSLFENQFVVVFDFVWPTLFVQIDFVCALILLIFITKHWWIFGMLDDSWHASSEFIWLVYMFKCYNLCPLQMKLDIFFWAKPISCVPVVEMIFAMPDIGSLFTRWIEVAFSITMTISIILLSLNSRVNSDESEKTLI